MRKKSGLAFCDRFWLVFVLYFAGLTLFRFLLDWQILWLWLGGLLGVLLSYADRLVYVYLVRPEEPLSLAVKRLVSERKYRMVLVAFKQRGQEQEHLVLRSALFLGAWIPISIFVTTSSGSMLASGLILGLGLRLLYSLLADFHDPEKLKQWLFWQIKRPISDRELKITMGVFAVAFVIITRLMV